VSKTIESDRLEAVVVGRTANAVFLLAQAKRQAECGDYSLAQETCKDVLRQLEAAKQMSNRLADMLDVEGQS
jgi:hypothetical protein